MLDSDDIPYPLDVVAWGMAEDARCAVLAAVSHRETLPTPLFGDLTTVGDLALDLSTLSTPDGDTVGKVIVPDTRTDINTSMVLLDTALWLSSDVKQALSRYAKTCTYAQVLESFYA